MPKLNKFGFLGLPGFQNADSQRVTASQAINLIRVRNVFLLK
jgi:hypothetical protein